MDEMARIKAYKTGTKRVQESDGGEQVVEKQQQVGF